MMLKDKVALITGAGSENGRTIAIEFPEEGAKVVLINQESKDVDNISIVVNEYTGEGVLLEPDLPKAKEHQIQIRK